MDGDTSTQLRATVLKRHVEAANDPARTASKRTKVTPDPGKTTVPERGHCEHGRRRRTCKVCQGSGICAHGRHRYHCKECKGVGKLFANTVVSGVRVTSAKGSVFAARSSAEFV